MAALIYLWCQDTGSSLNSATTPVPKTPARSDRAEQAAWSFPPARGALGHLRATGAQSGSKWRHVRATDGLHESVALLLAWKEPRGTDLSGRYSHQFICLVGPHTRSQHFTRQVDRIARSGIVLKLVAQAEASKYGLFRGHSSLP